MTVYQCDNPACKALIKYEHEVYHLSLKTSEYVIPGSPGPDYQHDTIDLHFCKKCAKDIKRSLENIVLKMCNDAAG
ncbi:MAG: hypothetical protein KAS04_03080 [Candidatus Aenigmarchaeota archaeon]|nr:hypothetical protein [Candidatus Aenigmarchaeota archaeon]